jgi:uncharacterized protein (DUF1015 family)
MTMIAPFRGLRPSPEHESEIAAPPYDVLNSDEARQYAAGKPWSFLHVSKPEIDLPPDTDPHDPAVYKMAAHNLYHMLDADMLRPDPVPCYYVYRIDWSQHSQTGLVAAAALADYDSGRIRKHEHTRPDKEDDRVAQIEAINAQTGPVMMACPESDEITVLLAAASQGAARADITSPAGIRHRIWVVDGADIIALLTRAFEALPALYIADGHHRSAAAARVRDRRAEVSPCAEPDAPWRRFLTVIFPENEMKILDYNRLVRDLAGYSPSDLLADIGRAFDVTAREGPARPQRRGEFGMYLDGTWYRLQPTSDHIPADDPVSRLDISLLSDMILTPLLKIGDPRLDSRIDFVGGMRGLTELQQRVDSGEMAVAFALYPTSMEDLMAVADAGRVMPPKSTWFEPKLLDGLVSLMLD